MGAHLNVVRGQVLVLAHGAGIYDGQGDDPAVCGKRAGRAISVLWRSFVPFHLLTRKGIPSISPPGLHLPVPFGPQGPAGHKKSGLNSPLGHYQVHGQDGGVIRQAGVHHGVQHLQQPWECVRAKGTLLLADLTPDVDPLTCSPSSPSSPKHCPRALYTSRSCQN